MAKKRNLSWKLMAAATAALLLVIVLILALSDGPPPDPVEPDATTPRGFTFLDMHADTRLTDGLRSRLSDQLGSMAVEKQSVIDLELHHNGFLKTHFKRLDGLNRRLNYENGMKVRIEHDATKLIFRYSPLFDYVALYFANNSGKPLMFRIRAKKDGTDIVDTVREKYGPPRKISWEDRPGNFILLATRYGCLYHIAVQQSLR